MTTLLVRPQLLQDEGPNGYALRLAEANGLTCKDLVSLGFAFESGTLASWGCIGSGSENRCVKEYVKRIEEALQRYKTGWNVRSARYCPHCLSATLRWHYSWELLFVDACPEHEIWLIDTCQSCSKVLDWNRPALLKCDCGASLLARPPAKCPPAVSRLSASIATAVTGECRPFELFQPMNMSQIQRAIRLFGAYGTSNPERRPQKVSNLDQMEYSWRFTSIAAEIFCNWPQSFHRLLEQKQRATCQSGSGKMSGRFGYFYFLLNKAFPENEFSFMRDAFAEYICAHWRGAIGRRNTLFSTHLLEKLAWIPANHACGKLQISKRRLVELIKQGEVAGEERIGFAGRSFWVVRREDVDRVHEKRKGEIDLTMAAQLLGLTRKRLLRLIAWLAPGTAKTGGPGCPWSIPRHEFDEMSHIASGLEVVGTLEEEQVTLCHVLRFWPWSDRTIAHLLLATLEKALYPVGYHADAGKGINGWVFTRKDLKNWYRQSQIWPPQSMSVPQVARQLNVKQEVAYALVRNGFLPVTKVKINRRLTSRVTRENLRWFEENLVFARDLAQQYNTSPAALTKKLLDQDISPVAGPGIDNCRQLLFRRGPALDVALDSICRVKRPSVAPLQRA